MSGPTANEVRTKIAAVREHPIVFWGAAARRRAALCAQQPVCPAARARMCDAFMTHHKPSIDGAQARAQALSWMQYSVNATLTLSLRCALPPTAAFAGYSYAQAAGASIGARYRTGAMAFVAAAGISALGMALNALQVLIGIVLASLCMGLSGYFYAQAALDTWRPPRLIDPP